MWAEGRETDLSRLLDTPALAAKVSQFFLATGELYQFRYLTEAEACDEMLLNMERQRWKTDGSHR